MPAVSRHTALLVYLLLVAGLLLSGTPSAAAALTFIGLVRDSSAVDTLSSANALIVSPDGGYLYVVAPGDEAVTSFARNPESGALTVADAKRDGIGPVDGIQGANALALSPGGAHLYVAGFEDDAIAVFAPTSPSGALTFLGMVRDGIGGVTGLNAVSGVVVSPDGAHVYATGRIDGTLAIFARDGSTGLLTFLGVLQDGVDGVEGLAQASAIAISPGGRSVYVTGRDDDAVAVFARNPTSGALAFVEVQRNGVGGVQGLDGASAVTVSPDGHHVYVTGDLDDAVAVFARNGLTGRLTFVESARDGVGGVDGLDGAAGVAVSPDGARVYVAGHNGDALAVFARAAATGALTFLERLRDGVGGVDGLNGATGIAVSPDAAFVYVAGADDSAVAIFATGTTVTTTTVRTSTTVASTSTIVASTSTTIVATSTTMTSSTIVTTHTTATSTTAPTLTSIPTTSSTSTTLVGATCAPLPVDRCQAANASLFVLRNARKNGRDLAKWLWRGPAGTAVGTGNPARADHTLCIYGTHAGSQTPLLSASAPAGIRCGPASCWRTLKSTGYAVRYHNRRRSPDGIDRIVIRSVGSTARLRLVGKGAKLKVPALPLVPPVVVQLVGTDGACWEASYPSPLTNSVRMLKARSP